MAYTWLSHLLRLGPSIRPESGLFSKRAKRAHYVVKIQGSVGPKTILGGSNFVVYINFLPKLLHGVTFGRRSNTPSDAVYIFIFQVIWAKYFQWRIENSRRGRQPRREGAPNPEILYVKIKESGPLKGHALVAPPGSATDIGWGTLNFL